MRFKEPVCFHIEPRERVRWTEDQIQMGSKQEGSFAISTTIRSSPKSKVTHLSPLHRSKRDAVEYAVAGLNLLGISLSLADPITGSIVSAIAIILPLIFPGGDPKHIQDIVWDERAKQQKMKMLDFKNQLEDILEHSKTNNETAQRRLLILFESMNTDQCSFMHTDSVRSSAAHFQSFATLHLQLNLLLIITHERDRHWQRILERNVDAYVKYGYFVIQKDATNIRDLRQVYFHSLYVSGTFKSFKWNVREELNPSIQKWIQILPNAIKRNDLFNYGSIRDDGLISLKIASYENPLWLSCWAFYWLPCDDRSCPGEDNPMNPGCKGEKFQIKAIDEVEDGSSGCVQGSGSTTRTWEVVIGGWVCIATPDHVLERQQLRWKVEVAVRKLGKSKF